MIQNKPNNPPLSHCENCQSRISQKQLQLINKNQEAVFCSYCGDYLYVKKKFVDKQTSNNEFLNNNKSSNINQYKRESFEHYITLFAARIIYDSIIQANLNSKPIESYIDKLAHALRLEFSEKPLNQEWLGVFRNNSRKKFKKRYKEFQARLKRNVKYQENFIIFSKNFIKSMLELIYSEKELSTLKGIERDIANDLINRKLFVSDKRFPENFKQNLIIALSRLIYIKMKYLAQKNNAKVSQIDLDQKVIAKIAESTKNNISTLPEINHEYLNKLYGITLNQFNAAYQNLRTELNASKIYAESFKYTLQRLIKNLNLLLSGKRESASRTNLEQIIIFELKNLEIRLQKKPNLILESSESKNLNVTKEKTHIETDENESKNASGQIYSQNTKKESNIKYTLVEIDFLKSKGINIYNLKSRWEWIDLHQGLILDFINEIIIPDLINTHVLERGEVPKGVDLEKNGYEDFYQALRRRKIKYIQFLKEEGFDVSYDPEKWSFLRNLLDYNQKLETALDFFLETIVPNLLKKDLIKEGGTPKQKDIDQIYGGFLAALLDKRCKITYNELLQAAEFELNLNTKKWLFLDYDQHSYILSQQERIIEAAKYFNNIIVPDLINKRIIKKNDIAKYKDLRHNNHGDFLNAIKRREILYNDVLRVNNLEICHDNKKFEFLKKDNEGNILTYEQVINNAIKHLIKTIIPDLISKKLIKRKEIPTQEKISAGGYKSFINAILKGRYKITYNDLLESAGFSINYDPNRWKILDLDYNGNPLNNEQRYIIASNYLKNIIYPDLVKRGVITKGQAPTRAQLERYGHTDFLCAYWYRNMLYDEIVELTDLKLTKFATLTRIGTYFHWIMEYLFLNHTRIKDTYSYYEVRPSRYTESFSLRRSDNSIIVEENFNTLSLFTKEFSELRPKVKLINIDYHLGESLADIRDKCYRGYQGRNKFLFIVSMTTKDNIITPMSIPYRKNVQILDLKTFATFFGFPVEIFEQMKDLKNLALSAIIYKQYLNSLRNLSKTAEKSIKKSLNFSQKEFELFLKSSGLLDLLKPNNERIII